MSTTASNITSAISSIVTSNRTYGKAMAGMGASVSASISVIADMDSGDTAIFKVATTNTGGKIDDITGVSASRLRNFVSGYLVC